MSLIDYKIVSISENNNHIEIGVRIYRGAREMRVLENNIPTISPVRNSAQIYVRNEKLGERTFSFDVPRAMSQDEVGRMVRSYLNTKIAGIASKEGITPLPEQQETRYIETVSNEKEL